jgi:hypothetical protein
MSSIAAMLGTVYGGLLVATAVTLPPPGIFDPILAVANACNASSHNRRHWVAVQVNDFMALRFWYPEYFQV